MINPIAFALGWLSVGAAIWALLDPAHLRQLFIDEHLAAFRYLPSRGKLFFAHCGAIVVMPVVGAIWLVSLHKRVWGA